jgi:hypothetical protein
VTSAEHVPPARGAAGPAAPTVDVPPPTPEDVGVLARSGVGTRHHLRRGGATVSAPPRGRPQAPRAASAGGGRPHAAGQVGSWTYTETIDDARAVIEVRGRVDRLAADLLRGTVEHLHRRGHPRITVALGGAVDVEPDAHALLDELTVELARCGAELVVEELPTRLRGVS